MEVAFIFKNCVAKLDIKVDSLFRGGHGKISPRKLRREAMKTRINPALNNPGTSADFTNGKIRELRLNFKYGNSVDVLEAYGHARDYEVLANEIGSNMNWYNPQIKINSPSELNLGPGTWILENAEKNNGSDRIKISIGLRGDYGRGPGDDFDRIFKSQGYTDTGLVYKGENVLSGCYVFLESFLEDVNPEIFSKKVKAAEAWLKPYQTLRHLTRKDEKPEGLVKITHEIFLEKKTPAKIAKITVKVPLGDFNGSNAYATYVETLKD